MYKIHTMGQRNELIDIPMKFHIHAFDSLPNISLNLFIYFIN